MATSINVPFNGTAGSAAIAGKDISTDICHALIDIIGADRLQAVVDDFYELTKMSISVIGVDGRVVVQAGWNDICTQFHRQNPRSLQRCVESETHPTMYLVEGEVFEYKCKNLMWHIVTPIFIEGKHIGNVFLGQFFYDDEDLDTDLFIEQAQKYGFKEEEYLAALKIVPRWSREYIKTSIRFCVNLTTLVSELGLSKLNLMRENGERRRVEEELRKANEKLNLLSNITRHDINNQLMVLKGNLDFAMRNVQDPAVLSRMAKIDKAADNIEKQISFTKDYQDLGVSAPCWQKICERVADYVKILDIKQLTVCDRGRDLELIADPMIGKVFYNLLENSVKHGGKMISASFCCQDCDNGDLLITYEDDGNGIPSEEKERIFERGYGKGTGLGLFLSREILAVTGMTIRENGEYGKGARFEMRVPKDMFRFVHSE
ncbi:MAG: PocR ligand-binding domain-containing protein [Methanomassiliicoccus sp.]|nr:PocR ligand-binding domain-containing protein [Methanomassiliicoccus sp.]